MSGKPSSARRGRGLPTLLLGLGAVVWMSCHPARSPATVEPLAPGVRYHQVYLAEGPWAIHVLEIDLATAWQAGVRLRTARADPRGGGLEKTSAMAKEALAAVNGDFWLRDDERVRSTGLQVSRGRLVAEPHRNSAFAMTADGKPLIDVFHLEIGLITSANQVLPVAHFNRPPAASGLAFYNHFAQDWQDSVHAELGFQVQSLDTYPAIGDTVSGVVLQVRRQSWPLRLEEDQWMVVAGPQYPLADGIAPGDTIRLFCLLSAVEKVEEAVGGGPRIVRDGVISVENEQENLEESFAVTRHPRTAVGYSQDRNTLFLVTVDGRQPGYSVGMSLEELARFMQERIGVFAASGSNAYQAINLDGGGNTTMVVRQQVVNRPSDPTGERAVANALLVVAGGSGS